MEKPNAPAIQLSEMQTIAAETGEKLADIEELYEEVFRATALRARVTDYLALFVAKKVKERLRESNFF